MANYETTKEELQDNSQEETYVVEPSRAEYYWDEESETLEDAPEEGEPNPVSAEGEKTEDIDLSMLDLPEEKVEEQALPDPVDDAGFAAFASQFQKYTGVDFKEAISTFSELQQFRVQQKVESEKSELMQAWGVSGTDFEARLSEVKERFAKYTPEMQTKLNNPQGAQLIWAKIEQERGTKKTKEVPALDRGRKSAPASGKSQYDYTRAQISAMSNEEYAKNANRIAAAFAAGRVKN